MLTRKINLPAIDDVEEMKKRAALALERTWSAIGYDALASRRAAKRIVDAVFKMAFPYKSYGA